MADPARFIVVAGPPCAGKSFVARHLSRELDAPHLEVDRFRRRVLPFSDQRVEHRDIAYRAMHFTAELMAPWCPTLIVDATYTAEVWRADLVQVVERFHGALFVIECHVSASVAVERFLQRDQHPAVDLTAERVSTLASNYHYFTKACAVGGASAEDDELSRVLRYVRAEPLDRSGHAFWCAHGLARERPRSAHDARPTAERQ